MKLKFRFLNSIVVPLLTVVSILAQITAITAQPLGPISESFLAALRNVDATVDEVLTILNDIKLDDLKLSYREGKYLEGSRVRALKYASLIRRQTTLLRSQQTLQALFSLTSGLQGLDREVEALTSKLDLAIAQQERGTYAKANNWLNMLDRIADPLAKAILMFDNETFAFLGKADDALASHAVVDEIAQAPVVSGPCKGDWRPPFSNSANETVDLYPQARHADVDVPGQLQRLYPFAGPR